MPQSIIRIAKIKTKGAATGKTKHNYRLMDTPNADPERTSSLNQELVNTGQLDYWSLAENRIEEGIAKTARGKPRTVRDDQVRAVEIVLTASPDWFKRGEDRQAEDVRGSQWVTDNLDFLKNKYGEKNVVSFTLHQDETTPHIHAVVIPLTDKGRLSADTLFNPTTLKQLQTDYARAMAPHGLERGVEGSRRQHQDMKQVYGQQAKTAAELSSEVGPANSYQIVKVIPPSRWENLESWAAKTTDQVNGQARAQVEEANERAQKAVQHATANAGGQKQAEVLGLQLSISDGLKEGHYGKLVDAAKRAAGGEPASPALIEQGDKLLDKAVQDVQQSRERVAVLTKEGNQAEKNGDYALVASIRYGSLPREETHQKELETGLRGYKGGIERLDELDEKQAKLDVKQNEERIEKAVQDVRQNRGQLDEMREELRGQGIGLLTEKAWKITGTVEQRIKELETSLRSWKGGTERLDQLDAQMAQERTDKAKQQADEVYARAQDEARQKAENERQKPIVRENECQLIGQKALHVLDTDRYIYSGEDLIKALERNGVDVPIVDGKARFKLKGSENEFTGSDIRPGGKVLSEMVNERITTNLAQFQREVEKEMGKSKDQDQSM